MPMAFVKNDRESASTQHLAVFGESGSGKTVLLSSFYGHMTEPRTIDAMAYRVTAKDASQGTSLRQNYLGMRDSDRAPAATRFQNTSYEFAISIDQPAAPEDNKVPPGKQMSLIWLDYPGEWLEETPATPKEKRRQAETLKALMGSDVALLLIDADRLGSDTDTQASYLKSVLGNYRDSIQRIRNDLTPGGERLEFFPRVWVLTLSKADLVPDLTVTQFADLVTLHAGDEVNQLRSDISELVEGGAVALGEDYLRLSSAEFTPERIDTKETVGLDTIVPLAMLLPIQHFARWEERKILPTAKARKALGQFKQLADDFNLRPKGLVKEALSSPALRWLPGWKQINKLNQIATVFAVAAQLGSDQLNSLEKDAKAKRDYFHAAYLSLEATLAEAEERGVLQRKH